MQPGESFFSNFRRWYQMKPVALRTLIAVNVVLYLFWQIFLQWFDPVYLFIRDYLMLNPEIPEILLQPWQLITYNFLHVGQGFPGFLHIGFNMLWLYWMGRDYEEMHGSHRLLGLYILAGIGGGVMTVVLHGLFPGVINFRGPVYGASASVIGVLCAMATLYPNKGLGLLFLGVIPLKVIAIGFLVIDLVIGLGTSTSLSAHWGGALAGFVIGRMQMAGYDPAAFARIFFPKPRSRYERPTAQSTGGSRVKQWFAGKRGDKGMFGPPPRRRGEEAAAYQERRSVEQQEVDRILDKISEKGFEALTDEEKKTLFEASQR